MWHLFCTQPLDFYSNRSSFHVLLRVFFHRQRRRCEISFNKATCQRRCYRIFSSSKGTYVNDNRAREAGGSLCLISCLTRRHNKTPASHDLPVARTRRTGKGQVKRRVSLQLRVIEIFHVDATTMINFYPRASFCAAESWTFVIRMHSHKILNHLFLHFAIVAFIEFILEKERNKADSIIF